jgi:hypothetical protein
LGIEKPAVRLGAELIGQAQAVGAVGHEEHRDSAGGIGYQRVRCWKNKPDVLES